MTRRFLLVGLTGGLATGKSTVSAILTSLGCVVLDADVLAREVSGRIMGAFIRARKSE